MGWLRSGLPFPVSCLALVWVAGCGSLKVLQKPTCFSDYLSLSTCEWQLDQALECRATLHLFYQLLFNPDPYEESHVCVPENSAAAACVCHMGLENLVTSDTYQLDLWAGRQLLWRYNFTPSQHVKARAPVNLTLSTNVSSGWLLSWSNLYPPWNYLHNRLTYQVHVASESQPEHVKVYNVTYKETTLHLEARDLASGVTYTARVRALAQLDGSTWSAWSPGATWENYYGQPLEQRLKMGLVIACFVVALVCLSCYCSVTRIKREWWDQIPNPACSPAVAIVIQGPQVSAWEKRPRGQQPGKCPHWKTCLTKLLPCLLEHGVKKDEDLPKAARNRALNGPGKSAWSPVEVSKTVLLPETISVVRCVELFEAPRKAEEEDEEEEEEEDEEEGEKDFGTSVESGQGFTDGREGIAARLTESLLLGLLGAEEGGPRVRGCPRHGLLVTHQPGALDLPAPPGTCGRQRCKLDTAVSRSAPQLRRCRLPPLSLQQAARPRPLSGQGREGVSSSVAAAPWWPELAQRLAPSWARIQAAEAGGHRPHLSSLRSPMGGVPWVLGGPDCCTPPRLYNGNIGARLKLQTLLSASPESGAPWTHPRTAASGTQPCTPESTQSQR
ncbi:interleukin-4 receptor subunit alpha [Fukomys damarensis]|uniref:interleukin-4 receptor subunit alpha n=1 Tax=Fukomys damarensis TaxID=885580 RepID=UPI0014557EEF|nr:interleukin-4 receptor subunit alpha [Fukomys damarensis]